MMVDTEIRKSRFKFEKDDPKEVGLWNFAPIWPGRDKARLDEIQLARLIQEAYYRTTTGGHLILWMPATELHRTPFDPVEMCLAWSRRATIISGSDPIHIGYVYSKGGPSRARWTTKLILDERGKRGPNSSHAVKFVLETLLPDGGFVVDPYAHKSGILPIWCRRLGISYRGHAASKASYQAISKGLAQVELPGIQIDVPLTTEAK
jgi:hypothetical protein